MVLVSAKVGRALDDEEKSRLLGVGASGTRFAKNINPQSDTIGVSTLKFKREREMRELLVEEKNVEYKPTIVDDIAVSGLTLQTVVDCLPQKPQTVAIGLQFRSKRTCSRIGIADVRTGLTYCREGGGNPPINSVETLRSNNGRLNDLTERYFADQKTEFIKRILGDVL